MLKIIVKSYDKSNRKCQRRLKVEEKRVLKAAITCPKIVLSHWLHWWKNRKMDSTGILESNSNTQIIKLLMTKIF